MQRPARPLAQALDEMRRLAEETGGFAVTASDPAAEGRLADIATGGGRAIWLDLAFCDVPPASLSAADTLEVEILGGGERRAWTGRVPFDQDGLGAATQPCAGAGQEAPADSEPAEASPIALALGALTVLAAGAFGAGFFALRRRRPAPPTEPPLARPPSEPPRARSLPPPEPAPPPTSATRIALPEMDEITDDFDIRHLPETRLVVTQAPPGANLVPWYRLTQQTFFLGASDADLLVDVAQVSGRHARLELFPSGRLFLTDLDSTNGTFLNGRQLARGERVLVNRGDVIGLTRHVLFLVEQPGIGAAEQGTADAARQRERTLYAVPRNGDS